MRSVLGGGMNTSSNTGTSSSEVEPLMSASRDGGSMASDVVGYDRGYNTGSANEDSSNAAVASSLTNRTSPQPRILRQRNSGAINGDPPSDDFVPGNNEAEFSNSSTNGIVSRRKQSDFDNQYNNKHQIATKNQESLSDVGGIGRLRTREEVVNHFWVELQMLWRDAGPIGFGILMQWIHSVCTNIAYYYHTELSAAQRIPLKDVAYEVLPVLRGAWWMVSEYLVYSMVTITIAFIVSCLFVRWKAPHRRPLYSVPITKRLFVTLTVLQVLRCISFLVTTLPGASRQCLYSIPESMSRDEMIYGVAPDRGNPSGWSPPESLYDILWRVDATNGCGDLMFSSHTIFTMLFVCIIWHYFNWGFLKWAFITTQIVIIPLILAAHKHYSVDVFTALYVTPLVYELLRMKMPDMDVHSSDMKSHYGITFERVGNGFLLRARGLEYFVEPFDVPVDLRRMAPIELEQSAELDTVIV
ncbi:Phosphatidylinositol:ceramide inositolphosphotransferase [Seminavis robusta]|uniref:Phosphatidylinositol:ceramide inositolphosphotransferase n=1 Tax=Seminavis robusta TaxID=568900 RepID=A0A9N8HFD1_9STRA|nr:Phosphatidylinositol:ceramide inositolphosphotransferase [Seminavis robusta]|eukprot:Sro518_g158830.1 Phosphatidylinositol:ceramide inositolphosphotransferase (470) ;mRNA; f:35040-36542